MSVQAPAPKPQSRPFEDYRDQPDTEARKRLELQAIPFALPDKRLPENGR